MKICEQVVWLNTSVSEEKLFAFLTFFSFAYGVLNHELAGASQQAVFPGNLEVCRKRNWLAVV